MAIPTLFPTHVTHRLGVRRSSLDPSTDKMLNKQTQNNFMGVLLCCFSLDWRKNKRKRRKEHLVSISPTAVVK